MIAYFIFTLLFYIWYVFSKNKEDALRNTLKTLSYSNKLLPYSIKRFRTSTNTYLAIPKSYPQIVRERLYIFPNRKTNRCIFYIHGGGYISGLMNAYIPLCSEFQSIANVVYVNYRLCPEFTLTDSLNDLENGYNWAKKYFKYVVIVGDSAGGGLAIRLRERLNIKPFTLLYSPWIDIYDDDNSNKDDLLFDKELIEWVRSQIRLGNEPKNISFDKTRVLAFYGNQEFFEGDSLELYKKFKHSDIHFLIQFYNFTCEAHNILMKSKKLINNVFNKLEFIGNDVVI